MSETPRALIVYESMFGTRIRKVRRLPGSAARSAAKILRHRDFRAIAPSASFFVDDTVGPVEEQELERARQWGEDLGQELQSVLGTIRRGTRRSA